MKPALWILPSLLAAVLALTLWTGSAATLHADGPANPPATAPAPRLADTASTAQVNPEVRNLTPAQVEEFLAILHEQNPKLETRIRDAMAEYPETVKEIISRHWAKVKPLIDMKRHDPEMFELKLQEIKLTRQCDDLSKRLRANADPGMADQNKEQIKQLLSERFDVRQKMRDLNAVRIEKQAQDVRANIQAQLKSRDKTLAEELKAVLAAPPQTRPRRAPDTRPAGG
jgi:hypothetical protein